MWIYTDDAGRVLAANNMTGNSGWTQTDCAVPDALTDGHGAPLYALIDGQITPRAQADVQADWPEAIQPAPTAHERLAAVEEAVLGLLIGGAL